MATQPTILSATGTYTLENAGNRIGTGSLVIVDGTSWSGSLVLKVNTAYPGEAQALSNIAYRNRTTGAAVTAGTAITAFGVYEVDGNNQDLVGSYTHTSGQANVTVLPMPQATSERTSALGTEFGRVFSLGPVTTNDSFKSTSALATPATMTATQFTGYASAVNGAAVMGYGSTYDAALVNQAGTTAFGVLANSTDTKTVGSHMMGAAGSVFQRINGAGGAVSSGAAITKAISAIADNTFTDVFTVTVPNAAHAGTIKVTFQGVKGAGDAEGAAGSVSTTDYNISIQRTAGATTTAATSAALGTIATTIAAGNAVLTTAQCSGMTGGVGATQTFTIQVKIARAAGASTNHTCFAKAELLNSFATGITIA